MRGGLGNPHQRHGVVVGIGIAIAGIAGRPQSRRIQQAQPMHGIGLRLLGRPLQKIVGNAPRVVPRRGRGGWRSTAQGQQCKLAAHLRLGQRLALVGPHQGLHILRTPCVGCLAWHTLHGLLHRLKRHQCPHPIAQARHQTLFNAPLPSAHAAARQDGGGVQANRKVGEGQRRHSGIVESGRWAHSMALPARACRYFCATNQRVANFWRQSHGFLSFGPATHGLVARVCPVREKLARSLLKPLRFHFLLTLRSLL